MGGLLKSRKFWLSVIAVAVVVAVKVFNIPEETANEIADSVTTIILVLVAAIAGEDIAKHLRGKKGGK